MPQRLPFHSLFVLISMEQPKYATILENKQYLEKNFDLLATYSRQPVYPGSTVPNMPITYFPLNIVSVQSIFQPSRPFHEKTGYNTGRNKI